MRPILSQHFVIPPRSDDMQSVSNASVMVGGRNQSSA
jgi:hypothetical protein